MVYSHYIAVAPFQIYNHSLVAAIENNGGATGGMMYEADPSQKAVGLLGEFNRGHIHVEKLQWNSQAANEIMDVVHNNAPFFMPAEIQIRADSLPCSCYTNTLSATADKINRAQIPYNSPGASPGGNSNGVTWELLASIGLSAEFWQPFTGSYPGYHPILIPNAAWNWFVQNGSYVPPM